MRNFLLSVLLISISFSSGAQATIKGVYFAQTHVVTPDYVVPGVNEKFELISNRQALIKVNITSPTGEVSPIVRADLELNGTFLPITLTGPVNLPTTFNSQIGEVVHSFDDSFTGVIPKEWLQPNLKVLIVTPAETLAYNNLTISAPNRMVMTNFEVDIFSKQTTFAEFPTGWEAEFAEKFPASEFNVQNVRVLFKQTSVPPTDSRIAARISSALDYETLTGYAGFGTTSGPQNLTATEWKAALRDAAGKFYGSMTYAHVSWKFDDRANKGVGGGYSSVSRRGPTSLGILIHEMGHALSLPHWGASYPYIGDMYGIKASTVAGGIHSGPIWMYDAANQKFIPPTQNGVTPLTFKNDPMQGGGDKLKEPGYLTNHFSDYSVNQMRGMLEGRLVVYNEAISAYAKWDNTTKGYTNVQANTNNVNYPIQRDVDVISVLAAASSKTPQANIVYEPVGPYKSGLIQVFDPQVPTDRTSAATSNYCPNGGCDVTLKIEQGGVTKYLMLPLDLDATLADTDPASFGTRAVNLPASAGEVTKVELLDTPDAQINGLPGSPTVLFTWLKSTLTNSTVAGSETIKVYKTDNNTLRVAGFNHVEKATLKLLAITGKEVFAKQFTTKNINDMTIPAIANGIYIVQITSEKNIITKKIIFN